MFVTVASGTGNYASGENRLSVGDNGSPFSPLSLFTHSFFIDSGLFVTPRLSVMQPGRNPGAKYPGFPYTCSERSLP